MTESFGIIPITVAAFAGTNLDNVLLLIALLSASGIRRRQVIGGYLFAMFLLLGISFAVGKAAELIPAGYLGYLGIVPFSLGIISLIRLIPGEKSGPADPEPKLSSASSVFAATTLIQLSNSADTLATFSILLAESTLSADGLILCHRTVFSEVQADRCRNGAYRPLPYAVDPAGGGRLHPVGYRDRHGDKFAITV